MKPPVPLSPLLGRIWRCLQAAGEDGASLAELKAACWPGRNPSGQSVKVAVCSLRNQIAGHARLDCVRPVAPRYVMQPVRSDDRAL